MNRKVIDCTLRVNRQGVVWQEAHWMESSSLDDPLPRYRVVEIADGDGMLPPMIAYVAPDRGRDD